MQSHQYFVFEIPKSKIRCALFCPRIIKSIPPPSKCVLDLMPLAAEWILGAILATIYQVK
jgi:hypothetical protein